MAYNGHDRQFKNMVNEVRCNECKKYAPKIDSFTVHDKFMCSLDCALKARDKQDRRRIK